MKLWPFGKKSESKPTGRRGFAAAMYGRLVSGWITSSTSMDAEIKTSLRAMRDRSRQLGRDNDYVRGFFETFKDNVIGEGIPFQGQVKLQRGNKLDKNTNQLIESKWKRWTNKRFCHTGGTLFFQDIERVLAHGIAESGEIFVRKIRQSFGGSRIPFALEIIEADQLEEMELTRANNGNEIRMGVEVDQWQRPVAYHFRTRHPGDYPFGGGGNRPSDRIRVPADEIIHLGIKSRPNQTRSIPILHSAIMRIHQMGGYEEAEIIAARGSAALMGFIETPDPDSALVDDTTETTDANGQTTREKVSDFQPGVFKYLAPGEKVIVPDLHRPGGQFEPFMRVMLRAAAAGASVSYATLSRDYSTSNFSSSRMDMLSERDHWRILQKWFIRNFHQEVFEAWLEMAVLSGELPLKNFETQPERYQAVKWMPRGWAWIDPLKEVNAAKEAILGGLSNLSHELAGQGHDIEEMLSQRRNELDLIESLKLKFDTDFAIAQKKQLKPGKPSQEQDSSDKTDEETDNEETKD